MADHRHDHDHGHDHPHIELGPRDLKIIVIALVVCLGIVLIIKLYRERLLPRQESTPTESVQTSPETN